MRADLEPAKNVLRAFLTEIEIIKRNRKSISSPTILTADQLQRRKSEFKSAPDFLWEKENAYFWLHADAREFRSLMENPKKNPIPEYYSQPALPIYDQWLKEEKELFYRKCEKIPSPADGFSLIDYLQELALTVSEGNEHRDVWIESLRCFLQFLREDSDLDQNGPLEILFPSQESCKGMELRKNYSYAVNGKKIEKVESRCILRRIENTVYPIDILAASEILMHLSTAVLEGRPNSQRSAAEALGFVWLCHAVGNHRLLTRENFVFHTQISNLRSIETEESNQFKQTCFIGIATLFGIIEIPISKTLYKFLLALPRDPEDKFIFNMDWETVLRTFRNKGVKQSERARHLGQITFLTFMSRPHEAIGHRPFLKQKFFK